MSGGRSSGRSGDDPPFTYLLPIRSDASSATEECTAYLSSIAERAQLIIVDGSPSEVFAEHHRAWAAWSDHRPPDADLVTPMGKVGGVLTGLRYAAHDHVVIADDDIRYGPELADVVHLLERAHVVRPQNYFSPLPWHAAWDSARSLINRVTGGDWPGTLAVRRSAVHAAGGYRGDVMFENLELVRTVTAMGGQEVAARDLFVRRLPPTVAHFRRQRVRQAYDELARPVRLVVWSSVLPALAISGVIGGWRAVRRGVVAGAAVALGLAECGRRLDGAAAHFPLRCTLAAPLWAAERSVCVWLALASWLRGGIPYRDGRLRAAATPLRRLRESRRAAEVPGGEPAGPELAGPELAGCRAAGC